MQPAFIDSWLVNKEMNAARNPKR